MNVDLIRTLPMMAAGGLHDDTASDDASEAILKLRDIFDDFFAQAVNWDLSLEIDLDSAFPRFTS